MKRRVFAGAFTVAALLALPACQQQAEQGLTPPADNGGVSLHWDALTPYEAPENQYTRRWAEFTDHLIPADDYGNLIPFPGKAVYTDWMGDTWLYGLVTAEGEVIVDPVYSYAYQAQEYDAEQSQTVYLPYLLLQKVQWNAESEEAEKEIAIAALDGSWVRDGYAQYYGCSDGLLALGTVDGCMEVLNGDGGVRWSKNMAELELSEDALAYGMGSFNVTGGMLCYWTEEDTYLLNLAEGTMIKRAQSEIGAPWWFSEGLALSCVEVDGTTLYGYVDKDGNWAIEPQYTQAETFHGGCACVTLQDGTAAVIDTEGQLLLHCDRGELFRSAGPDGSICYLNAERAEALHAGSYEYDQYRVMAAYDGSLQPVGTPAAGEMIIPRYDGSYWMLDDNQLTVGLGTGQTVIQLPEGAFVSYCCIVNDGISLEFTAEDGTYASGYYNLSGETIFEPGVYNWFYGVSDSWTGKAYFVGTQQDPDRTVIMDEKGEMLFSLPDGSNFLGVCGDLILVQDGYGAGLRTSSGEWVFRYLIMDSDL